MVALREVSTRLSAGEIAIIVVVTVGIAAVIGTGIGLGYSKLKKK
jgi:hypothetical protein